MCVSSESFAFLNLGYSQLSELGPGEIVRFTPDGGTARPRGTRCASALPVDIRVPLLELRGGERGEHALPLRRASCGTGRDMPIDSVAGVPDSGIAHAIGYAQRSGVPFTRPLISTRPPGRAVLRRGTRPAKPDCAHEAHPRGRAGARTQTVVYRRFDRARHAAGKRLRIFSTATARSRCTYGAPSRRSCSVASISTFHAPLLPWS